MIILTNHIIEVDGQRYVPYEVAVAAVAESTDVFEKVEKAMLGIQDTIKNLDNEN